MKVIKKAVKTVYRITCYKCGSELEADEKDVEWSKDVRTVGEVTCPVCDAHPSVRRFKDRSFIYEETEG